MGGGVHAEEQTQEFALTQSPRGERACELKSRSERESHPPQCKRGWMPRVLQCALATRKVSSNGKPVLNRQRFEESATPRYPGTAELCWGVGKRAGVRPFLKQQQPPTQVFARGSNTAEKVSPGHPCISLDSSPEPSWACASTPVFEGMRQEDQR